MTSLVSWGWVGGGAEMWTMKRNSNKTLIEWWGLEAADVHISGVRVENSNSRGATADSLCQLFTKRTANICWSVSLWLTDAWSFPGSPLALTFPPSLSLLPLSHIHTLRTCSIHVWNNVYAVQDTEASQSWWFFLLILSKKHKSQSAKTAF